MPEPDHFNLVLNRMTVTFALLCFIGATAVPLTLQKIARREIMASVTAPMAHLMRCVLAGLSAALLWQAYQCVRGDLVPIESDLLQVAMVDMFLIGHALVGCKWARVKQ